MSKYDEDLSALKALGCFDGYCVVAGRRAGQHGNAGCRCLDDLPAERRRRLRSAFIILRSMAGVDAPAAEEAHSDYRHVSPPDDGSIRIELRAPSPETGAAAYPGPAPEPVKPPATWNRCVKHGDELHFQHEYEPGTAARWALQDNIGRCPAFVPVRTPSAGAAPTPIEATRWPANNSGTLVWCGNKEHPQQRHYQADDCLLPRVAGPAMVPPQDCLNSCRLVLGEKDWCGVCRGAAGTAPKGEK